jgi:predicted nucleotide-binding protein
MSDSNTFVSKEALARLTRVVESGSAICRQEELTPGDEATWWHRARSALSDSLGANSTQEEAVAHLRSKATLRLQGSQLQNPEESATQYLAEHLRRLMSEEVDLLQKFIVELTDRSIVQSPHAESVGNSMTRISTSRSVFIGHGRASEWLLLEKFLKERLHLSVIEYNSVPTAGVHTADRLKKMLDEASFAFLVMTAEDERADSSKTARANVIHEVGLFQGRLGFEKAIVLLEHGCEEFSNITGLGQIRFAKGNIKESFEEVRATLEREGLIAALS